MHLIYQWTTYQDRLLLGVDFVRFMLSFNLKSNSSPEVMAFLLVSIRPPDRTGFSGCIISLQDRQVARKFRALTTSSSGCTKYASEYRSPNPTPLPPSSPSASAGLVGKITRCIVALYTPDDHSSIARPTFTRNAPGSSGTGASYHCQSGTLSLYPVMGGTVGVSGKVAGGGVLAGR